MIALVRLSPPLCHLNPILSLLNHLLEGSNKHSDKLLAKLAENKDQMEFSSLMINYIIQNTKENEKLSLLESFIS